MQPGDENTPKGLSTTSMPLVSLMVDDTTVKDMCNIGLGVLFPRLQSMTMASKTIQSSWLKMLRLPDLQQLHIKAVRPKRDASISDDYVPDFCDTLIKCFPRLCQLEMSYVALGNQKTELIVSSLKEHPHLKTLV